MGSFDVGFSVVDGKKPVHEAASSQRASDVVVGRCGSALAVGHGVSRNAVVKHYQMLGKQDDVYALFVASIFPPRSEARLIT